MSWKSALKKTIVPTYEFRRPAFPLHPVDWNRLVTVDFETFFDANYTLRKMSTSEYVRDPRFKIQMVGIKIGNKPTKIYDGKKGMAALKAINWSTHSLLCHNTAFDGFIMSHHMGIVPVFYYDTLSMARGLHSNEIGAGLDEVAKFYGGQGKIDGFLEKTKDVIDWSPALFQEGAIYCAQDNEECFRVFKEMHAKYPADEIALIDLTIRMFCHPVLKVDIPRVEAEYAREVEKREKLFYSVVNPEDYDLGGKLYDKELHKKLIKGPDERELEGVERGMHIIKRLMGNNEFYADLLRAEGIEPPVKVSKSWIAKPADERDDADKYSYAFAKDDLEFVGLPDNIDLWRGHLDPNKKADVPKISAKQDRIRLLVEARLATKSQGNITRAERFLEAGKDGMCLPVGYSYYRAHCLTGDAQVLTRSGWVALADWQGGEIAQWSPDGSIRFAPATANAFEVHENLVQADSRYHQCTYTKGHTLPTYTSYGTFKPRKAGEALETRFGIPLTGMLDGTADITPLQAQLAAMVQADGSVRSDISRGRSVRFGFTKYRKIQRCKQLLKDADIPYMETLEDKVVRIRIGAPDYERITHLLDGDDKRFSPKLLDAPLKTKQVFLSELSHWDGDVESQPNGFTYSTTNEYNAQFVATMAHLCGRAAFISKRDRVENWSTSYRVYIRSDKKTRSMPKDYKEVEFIGKVYCPTTETGYFMVRQNNRIVVTGNTGRWGGNNKMNMQNLTRGGELRLSILAPKGHQIAVQDSGQIEARVNGWLWDQHDLLDAFRKADQWDKSKGVARGVDRDAYCRFADSVYGREITTDDKMERFVGKVCVLGLGYQMGAPKFQMTLAKGALGGPPVYFEESECYRIVNAYRSINHKIRDGWGICSRIIEDMAAGREGSHKCISWEKETLWLPNGMALKYPDLRCKVGEKGWDEWSYQSGDSRSKIYGGLLCENIVQALARIIVGTQMLWISKKYRVVMTTHDEIVALPKTAQAEACIKFMAKCMSTPLDWCPDIPLNCEGGYASNYSK